MRKAKYTYEHIVYALRQPEGSFVPRVLARSDVLFVTNKVGLRYVYLGLCWQSPKLNAWQTLPTDSTLYNTLGGIGSFLDDGYIIVGSTSSAKRVNIAKWADKTNRDSLRDHAGADSSFLIQIVGSLCANTM